MTDRTAALLRAYTRCPACGNEDIQYPIGTARPALWRCCACREEYTFEPEGVGE